MKVADRLLIKNLANTARIVNTINGGMVEPIQHIEEFEHGMLWHLDVPGVSIDNIKIEVKEDFLFVYQMLNDELEDMELPYMVGMLSLSNRIDLELISAEYDEDEILIHLPFNEATSGFQREIDILKK